MAERSDPADVPGYRIAVMAESMYLVNLMLAPGLAFLVLAWLWHRHHRDAPPLARCHLDQTFYVSLIGGAAIVVAVTLVILAGGPGKARARASALDSSTSPAASTGRGPGSSWCSTSR